MNASDTTLNTGQLWDLSWDARVLGHAMISSVLDGYVLVWPVTMPDEPAFSPGLALSASPLGHPVTIWPTRETGIGLHLLDRNLGQLLDRQRVIEISDALDEDADPGLPFAPGHAADEHNDSADVAMLEHWADLCFNVGAVHRSSFLDSEKIRSFGGTSKATSELLGLPPQVLRGLWDGLEPVSDEQLDALATSLGVDPHDITTPDPWAHVLANLSAPDYKQDVKRRANELGRSEEQLRLAVRSDFALAARDDRSDRSEQKLRDAIRRVGR